MLSGGALGLIGIDSDQQRALGLRGREQGREKKNECAKSQPHNASFLAEHLCQIIAAF
jgi:hypothetical protein